jgi:tetratricopeptide (TPR) repeat protein
MFKFGEILKRAGKFMTVLLLCYIQDHAQTVSSQDTALIDGIIKDAKNYVTRDHEKAIRIVNQALALAEAKQYKRGIASSYNVLGTIYEGVPDSKKAIRYYNLGKKIAADEKLEALLGNILYNSASVYEDLGDYDEAFKITEQAMAIKRRLNDSVGIARCYRQIAQHLSFKKDYVASIAYLQKALAIQRQLDEPANIAKTLNALGLVYTTAKQYDRGLKALKEGLAINEGDSLYLKTVYLNTGFCYDGMGMTDSAEHYYLKTLVISDILGDANDKMAALNNLGELYFQQNKLSQSETTLLEALATAKTFNSPIDLRDIQANLSALYAAMNDYKKAWYYQGEYIKAADLLMNEEKMKAVEELSVKFETREMEERNTLLQKENDLQKSRLQQRNYLIITILLFAGLVVTILFLYARQNKFRIQKENLDIEQKLLQIQMNPHFIFNSLQAIQSFILTNRQKESAGYLTSFSRLMRLILENSKHEFIGLDKEIDTLTYYLELQQLRFKEVFSYHFFIDPSIDKEFMLVPPMLLQPFIENAIEHGFKDMKQKGILNVTISKAGEQLVFEVIDNGVGIEKAKLHKQAGKNGHHSYALEIIQKRIEVLNQKLKTRITLSLEDLSLNSAQEQGTKISLYIPIITKNN